MRKGDASRIVITGILGGLGAYFLTIYHMTDHYCERCISQSAFTIMWDKAHFYAVLGVILLLWGCVKGKKAFSMPQAMAGVLAAVIAGLLAMVVRNVYVMPAVVIGFIVAFLGARIARQQERNMIAIIAGCGLIVIPFLIHGQALTFPSKGSLAVRHQWASRFFGSEYARAVDLVVGNKKVRQFAGDTLSVGPAVNATNERSYHMGGFSDYFSFDIAGNKANGFCKIRSEEGEPWIGECNIEGNTFQIE